MRELSQYSTPEWLSALPLKHGLKQWRNDAWRFVYERRQVPGLSSWLEEARACTAGRSVLAVIAFEQPWALDWLLRMAQRHLVDARVLVFDNSRQPRKRVEIAERCAARGAPYLGLPPNRTRHVNRSHGLAMAWAYRNVIAPLAPARFGFIDHDLIPVRPLAVAERLGSQPFFGMQVASNWAWQLWAGYCLFDGPATAQRPLNFLYDFANGLDTGGRNWRPLYRHHDARQLRFADTRFVPVRDPATGDVAQVQVVDDRWLHIGGIGYNDNFEAKATLCRHLAQALDAGASGDELACAP